MLSDLFFFFENRERNSIILSNLYNFETKPSEDRFPEKWATINNN